MPTNDQPDIAYVRDEVTEALPKWQTIADCLEGQDAIKANDLAASADKDADRYLPKPNASDTSDENTTRYEQYIERACWYNVTGRTHRGMVGQTFQKSPVLELPAELVPLVEDVDGCGVSLLSQAAKADGYLLAFGRAGLLTDYPGPKKNEDGTVAETTTVADMQTGNFRPTIVLYKPEAIINWRTAKVGARNVLTLVVLYETSTEDKDGFAVETVDQWRVLRLVDGVYTVEVFRDDSTGVKTSQGVVVPQDRSGKHLTEIPFQFLGSENNDAALDLPPLGDLADLNIAHYRNSADYEESVFLCGQPTPWAAGLTQAWVDKNFKDGVAIGSRAVLPLPVGGACGLLQAAPNTLPREAMQDKERQMVALGARLVEQREVQRTATEARQAYAAESSVLGMCARNVAAGYLRALGWAARFMGATGESTFEIDADAALREMSPEQLRELVAAWQGDAISTTEMRDKLKSAGIATQDDDDYKAEVDSKPSYALPAAAAAIPAKVIPQDDDGAPVDEETPAA